MSDPIKAYWWRRLKNFGDAINPDILSYMSGRKVQYVDPVEADIISIGSIINNADEYAGDEAVYVWGAGALSSNVKRKSDRVIYAAVRGPLTADALGLYNVVFGDPGLLISDIVPRRAPNGRTGIVLHHSRAPDPALLALVGANPERFELISPVQDRYLDVVRQISACSHVFSSSLHGLIVADAYGIPNTWLDPAGNHEQPRFKFRDYAAGIGRFLGMPLPLQGLVEHLQGFRPPARVVPYAQNVEQTKFNLRAAFPQSLKL